MDAAPIDGQQLDAAEDYSSAEKPLVDGSAVDGRIVPAWGCPFPYTVPQKREVADEMGTWTAHDVHVRCRVADGSELEILVKAIAVKTGTFVPVYEAQEAFVCREGVVEPLETFSYSNGGRHGWKQMEVTVDDRIYRFDYSETCIGARPCTSFFDEVDIIDAKTEELLQTRPALCAGVSDGGVPRPLVPQQKLAADLVATDAVAFSMGSTEGDTDEVPVHSVSILPVRVDEREATNADLALFLTDHGNDCDGYPCVIAAPELKVEEVDGLWQAAPGFADHPAVQVTWYGAFAYCNWRGMSLPKEAQWEAAASVFGQHRYPWGDDAPSCELATYDSCAKSGPEPSCSTPQGNTGEETCDLAGNVAEWVWDWYQSDFYAVCDGNTNQPCASGPLSDTGLRVVRGGSFKTPAPNLRAADRSSAAPDSAAADIGLRCVTWNPS